MWRALTGAGPLRKKEHPLSKRDSEVGQVFQFRIKCCKTLTKCVCFAQIQAYDDAFLNTGVLFLIEEITDRSSFL